MTQKRACLQREILEEIGVNRWQQAKDGEGGITDMILNINGERNKIWQVTKTFISKVWKKRKKRKWKRIQEQRDHNYLEINNSCGLKGKKRKFCFFTLRYQIVTLYN